jgi:translation elongation factor EF-1alpha
METTKKEKITKRSSLRSSFDSAKEIFDSKTIWFEEMQLKRKKSVMLLPINEINENFSNPDRDHMLETESITDAKLDRKSVTLLITGKMDSGKNLLFSRLISKYHNIPFNTIRKEGDFVEGDEKPSECFEDIVISVLKGLVEDSLGSVKTGLDTPLPYMSITHDDMRFLIYSPIVRYYEEKLLATNPVVDILVHLIDINIFTNPNKPNDPETCKFIEDDISKIRQFRFKHVVFVVNKMDQVGWDPTIFDNVTEYINQAAK